MESNSYLCFIPLVLYSIVCSLLFRHTFQVKAKYNPSNLAYTSDGLPLHTDLPYYDYVPGVSESSYTL